MIYSLAGEFGWNVVHFHAERNTEESELYGYTGITMVQGYR